MRTILIVILSICWDAVYCIKPIEDVKIFNKNSDWSIKPINLANQFSPEKKNGPLIESLHLPALKGPNDLLTNRFDPLSDIPGFKKPDFLIPKISSSSNPFLNPKGWSAVKGWHNQGFNPIQSSPLLAADLPSPANYYPISGASNWQKVNSAISGVKKLSEKDKIRSEERKQEAIRTLEDLIDCWNNVDNDKKQSMRADKIGRMENAVDLAKEKMIKIDKPDYFLSARDLDLFMLSFGSFLEKCRQI